MPLIGRGVMVANYDIRNGWETRHDDWHAHEHMLERVAIPGFRRGRRYVCESSPPRCLVLYEVDDLATLVSEPYLRRLDHPTGWTRRIMPHMVEMSRTLARVRASRGSGIGGYLGVVQLRLAAGSGEEALAWVEQAVLPAIPEAPGLLAGHLLIGDRDASETPTEEKSIRGVPDAVADALLLVEGYEASTTRARTGAVAAAGALAKAGIRTSVRQYRLAQLLDCPPDLAGGEQ